jgi:uncharacterized phage protein (TIGR01671 family)
MSRQIKFRGLSTNDGRWIYGDLVHNAFDGVRGIDLAIKEYNLVPVQINEGTEGQFTGLHDSKGNEIYEGDIVEYTHISGDIEPNVFTWSDRVSRFLFGEYGVRNDEPERWNIIGNIHQNKSLEDK